NARRPRKCARTSFARFPGSRRWRCRNLLELRRARDLARSRRRNTRCGLLGAAARQSHARPFPLGSVASPGELSPGGGDVSRHGNDVVAGVSPAEVTAADVVGGVSPAEVTVISVVAAVSA